jgi:hypothetical protein
MGAGLITVVSQLIHSRKIVVHREYSRQYSKKSRQLIVTLINYLIKCVIVGMSPQFIRTRDNNAVKSKKE